MLVKPIIENQREHFRLWPKELSVFIVGNEVPLLNYKKLNSS